MSNKKLFSIWGILLIVLVVAFLFCLIFASNIYRDLKKMEQSVYNLHGQLEAASLQLNRLNAAGNSLAEKAAQFTEATKNWTVYQNDKFDWQLKSPASWGNLDFRSDSSEKLLKGFFTEDNQEIELFLQTYDTKELKDFSPFASLAMQKSLLEAQVGECANELFEKIKDLNIGEIRNCAIQSNILTQKFIIYRYVRYVDNKVSVDQLIAVFPRDDYYIALKLPDNFSSEIEYFIQSVVFL